MPTLNIQGRKVKVDDSFLQLSPEEQNATVEEIAGQLGAMPARPDDPQPAAAETPKDPVAGGDAMSVARTGIGGLIEGIPIAGPLIRRGTEKAAAATRAAFSDDTYDQALAKIDRMNAEEKAANPVVDVGSQVVGGIASMAPVAGTALGARALGITGPSLLARAGASAASGAAISTADSAARGGDGREMLGSGAIGGAIGGAVPIVGAGLGAAGRAIGERVAPLVGAIRDPAREAQRRVGVALQRDFTANPSSIMTRADEAAAAANNIPVLNVDRGGETTRALARSVANQSPEARQVIENVASDRFGTQSQRAGNFIQRLTGGRADDLAYQDALKATAKAVNKPAYDAAFNSPQAQQVFTPRIQQLMQSPTFRQAIDSVPRKSADRAAVQGFKEIGNPFARNVDGSYVLRRQPNGSVATPSLAFWDQVKINLDDKIGAARRAGKTQTVADLMGLKSALVDELDAIVPTYKTARAGAAGFFGAEDALDAGKKFANTPRMVPEAKQAFGAFKPAEKDAFATGFASELIDKIKASGDRTNVINSVFKSQASRESMEMVFGAQKAREIEAYVRVEDLVDRVRGALGNSTTARQLVEMGLGAGGGYAFSGDLQGAAIGAALTRGARFAGQRADAKVMEQMAKLLTSPNRGNLALAVKQAAAKPQYMTAIERLSSALAVPARSAGLATAQTAGQ